MLLLFIFQQFIHSFIHSTLFPIQFHLQFFTSLHNKYYIVSLRGCQSRYMCGSLLQIAPTTCMNILPLISAKNLNSWFLISICGETHSIICLKFQKNSNNITLFRSKTFLQHYFTYLKQHTVSVDIFIPPCILFKQYSS